MAFAEKRGWDKSAGKYRYRGRFKMPNGTYGSVSEDELGQPFFTKAAAKKYASGLETDVDRKTFVNPRSGRMQLGDWADVWIKSVDLGNRSDKTYRQRLQSVILPEWRHAAIADITTVAFSTWEKGLRSRYAPTYVKSVVSVFRLMLDDAVTSKVIGSNPIPTRKAQRRGKYRGQRKQDTTVLATTRQARLIAENAREMRGLSGYVLVLTIAYAALRISEAAGLRREHLLLDDRGAGARLVLTEQHQYVEGKQAQVAPKYGSAGSIILAPFHAQLLRELLDSHTSPWVFTAPRGGKLLPGAHFYRDEWRAWVDGRPVVHDRRGRRSRLPELPAVAGVENIVPHGLRHSHKVWLDEGRHPRVAVEERLRHVLPGIEGTYSHTTLSMELAIAAYLQELWENSQGVNPDLREFERPRARRGKAETEVDLPGISQSPSAERRNPG
ncbi:tyrosine-type recombinase/integrase [Streptomyces sp. NPDC127040]|uniref:tyrosine-type recombinase/integrase n=1 Tax=Streptomyces sp. NPDC127040 TaxID=3347116 RepID=UPI00364D3A1E